MYRDGAIQEERSACLIRLIYGATRHWTIEGEERSAFLIEKRVAKACKCNSLCLTITVNPEWIRESRLLNDFCTSLVCKFFDF